ncbi:hypothetical protein BC830DRAFT_742398 [Chytriomyces sp. MP71]|nr:hypothetical protein BC830DRAFT_742398 [Chytriomyces sp. MP71]
MLSRPSKTSTTKPDLPLKLPSSVCREKVNSSDLDLAKMFPSTVGGSQLFIAQERAENTRASASLKELRRFKSSRLDLRTHSHANTPYGTGVPKISRLHSVCTDSTHSPITTRTKSRQQTQHDLDIELENYAESTASVDTIEGATLDPIEHGHSEPPRNDTMDPSDSIAYPTLRGVQQLARQIRATSRVFLNANELLPNHSNARPASAPAADPPAIDEANSHPTPVTSSLQPHPPARGHSAAGFSQASTGRLISSGHARGGRAMRKATADSLVDIEKELGVVLVCHKLKSDPHAPNGRHLIASDSIRQHFKSGGRDDASGFDGHTNENTTELNDSSWFGDGEDGQASSDNFAIAEEVGLIYVMTCWRKTKEI